MFRTFVALLKRTWGARQVQANVTQQRVFSTEELNSLSRFSDKQVDRFENLLVLQNFLTHGVVIPSFHGWPISHDLAVYLLRRVTTENYDFIVEFGSGSSTLLIAKVLQLKATPPAGVRHIAFEHLEIYRRGTLELLAQLGNHDTSELVDSPLALWACNKTGREFQFYDCEKRILECLSSIKTASTPRILVLVDGPPGNTGPMARYPALPILLAAFPTFCFDFLLDDSNRSDEITIISEWVLYLQELKLSFQCSMLPFEKGACLLTVNPKN